MGWSIGYNEELRRDIGYGVPAICDHPDCSKEIDRGFGYVCGDPPYAEVIGCGLHFCGDHLKYVDSEDEQDVQKFAKGIASGEMSVEEMLEFVEQIRISLCERCRHGLPPFEIKPDTRMWLEHKMSDPSWAEWRKENGFEVAAEK